MPGINYPIEGVAYCPPALAGRYLASGAWIDKSFGAALADTAGRFPERPAFISDEETLTFTQLDQQTDRLAAALLELGFVPGDRMIFQMGTTTDTVRALAACYKAGIVPVCSIPQYREIEIGQLIRQAAPAGHIVQADFGGFDLAGFAQKMAADNPALKHVIVARGAVPAGRHGLEALIASVDLDRARRRLAGIRIGSEDVLSFQLSGGSTGIPKIIPRFHAEYLGHATGWMRSFRIDADSRIMWPLPLLHNAGQIYALIPAIAHGVTTVLMPRVDIARMLELIEIHKVTHALSIGPIAPQLATYPDLRRHDLSGLKGFGTMSRAAATEAVLGVPCSNFYGITEGLLLGSPPDAPVAVRHQTQGAADSADDEIRLIEAGGSESVPIGEVGELCFRGPSSLRGYFAAPEATRDAFTADGFFRSGDLMRAHRVEGRLYYSFEGRMRDNVNRGGEKIGCEEVEEIVCRHPAVADARLVPMPDPILGERGCIFVIRRPGAVAFTVPDLLAFLAGQGLAKFKCPERIEWVDEFPLTRVGKLDKQSMKRIIAQKLLDEAGDQAAIPSTAPAVAAAS